jgi:hypothetical protein
VVEERGLASIVLPEELGLLRDRIVPAKLRGAGFDAGYDFRTLVYDAVEAPGEGVRLYCPKLLNLEALLRAADIRLDGVAVRPDRVRRFERYDMVVLPETAGLLSIGIDGWRQEVAVSPLGRETFAGRNCLVTLSRNNDLRWIRDWAAFHVREHGAEAVLLFDNASTLYGPGEIAVSLAEVEGLRAIRVVPVPFLYGPQASKRMKFRANFLQAALLNLARFRFLADARAVLQCDVDELVLGEGGESVFDATVASRAGFLRIAGEWRYPDPAPGAMPLHRDHFRRTPEPRSCPPKYCIVPGGPMRAKSWATHGLHGVLFGRRFVSDRFRFLHCFGISDFWKGRPTSQVVRATLVDHEAARVLDRVFG